MQIEWTGKAMSDLARLFAFLAPVNRRAAAKTVQALTAAPSRLLDHPRLWTTLDEFQPREVRRLLIGDYEMRYEIQNQSIYILRFWHSREER